MSFQIHKLISTKSRPSFWPQTDARCTMHISTFGGEFMRVHVPRSRYLFSSKRRPRLQDTERPRSKVHFNWEKRIWFLVGGWGAGRCGTLAVYIRVFSKFNPRLSSKLNLLLVSFCSFGIMRNSQLWSLVHFLNCLHNALISGLRHNNELQFLTLEYIFYKIVQCSYYEKLILSLWNE